MISQGVGVEETQTWLFTWELDIDTNDKDLSLRLPVTTRFGRVVLWITGDTPPHLNIVLIHVTKKKGILGRDTTHIGRTQWIDKRGLAHHLSRVSRGPFADDHNDLCDSDALSPAIFKDAARRNKEFKLKSHRRFRFTYEISAKSPPAPLSPPSSRSRSPSPAERNDEVDNSVASRQLHARMVTSSVVKKHPNDVRLVFPRINAELWASSSVLSEASPYLKTLLASLPSVTPAEEPDRKRRKTRNSGAGQEVKEETPEAAAGGADGAGGDDSDEEVDNFLSEHDLVKLETGGNDGDLTYKEVRITDACYSTWRAVLIWLHTGSIDFSDPSSTFAPHNPESEETRHQALATELADEPLLPLTVSSKSVYRIAHQLEIPSLLEISLLNYEANLTIERAAKELFDPANARYTNLHSHLLAFVAENWAEAKATDGMTEVARKTKAGELPGAGAVYAELMPLVSA